MSREVARAAASSHFAFVFGIGLALLPALLASLVGLSVLQHRYFPIVDRFKVDEAIFDEYGDITISGEFYKLYPDWMCKYKSMQWFMPGKDPDGGDVQLRVSSSFGDTRKVKEQNNRQSGYNPFHSWKIHISEYPDLRVFSGFVTHRCLWVIPTRTYLPEYEAPPRTVEFKKPRKDTIQLVDPFE